jgi:hypothetical protein
MTYLSTLFLCWFQEAKETLCDPEKRSNYDKWRKSGLAISYKQWLGMKEHVHAVSILNLLLSKLEFVLWILFQAQICNVRD